MPSRASALLGNLGGEVSSQLSFMKLSYDFSTVVLESRKITYGGDSSVSDNMESLSESSVDEDAAKNRIGDTEMGILLMVTRAGA